MTPSGFQKLKADLHHLKTVERPHNVQEIAEARAHGDISENAEFHAAKERQGHIEARILQVEDRIARAQVIEPGSGPPDAVRFGTTVVLEDTGSGEEVVYTLVGEDESDAASGRLSISSPVARALLGKAEGDEVKVVVPKGSRAFEILEIRYD
ncbi:MAG: transcription elongation factor GreA [Myxococcales bacterium]|nr:transcription elongation factor GreA [Myxococcales bacterium]